MRQPSPNCALAFVPSSEHPGHRISIRPIFSTVGIGIPSLQVTNGRNDSDVTENNFPQVGCRAHRRKSNRYSLTLQLPLFDQASTSQFTACTGLTRTVHTHAPTDATAEVIANAIINFPVLFNTSPVTAGAATPARLPTKFCNPVHLPAADGPARVWVIAHTLEAHTP
jgi:hypothetical protein